MDIHVVRAGETVSSVAARYGVPAGILAGVNGIAPDAPLAVGQTLVVRHPRELHTVAIGESVYSIALRYGLSVRTLYQNNPALGGRSALYPGQTLVIAYDDTPGVSSFCGAAAALNAEYTLPTVSQTVIITRMEGRTPVPERETLARLASHGATMVIFLSIACRCGLQSHLARRKDRAVQRGNAGRKRPCSGHHQDRAHRGGRLPRHPV